VVEFFEAGPSAHHGMSAIRADDPAGSHKPAICTYTIRTDALDARAPRHVHAHFRRAIRHVAMKPRAPQAQSVVRGKQSRYAHCAFLESNAVEAVTACLLEIDSNRRRSRDSVGHDAFPTRLIDRWGGAI